MNSSATGTYNEFIDQYGFCVKIMEYKRLKAVKYSINRWWDV